jgi:hypothetical protein
VYLALIPSVTFPEVEFRAVVLLSAASFGARDRKVAAILRRKVSTRRGRVRKSVSLLFAPGVVRWVDIERVRLQRRHKNVLIISTSNGYGILDGIRIIQVAITHLSVPSQIEHHAVDGVVRIHSRDVRIVIRDVRVVTGDVSPVVVFRLRTVRVVVHEADPVVTHHAVRFH